MAKDVKFSSKSGEQLGGAIAEPQGADKTGGVIVLQEWFGVNHTIRGLVDRFAKAGFVALAPDLYHGKVAADENEAGRLMGALDKRKAVEEIGDAAAFLKTHPRGNGKVAVTGFCLGGALTLAAARHVDGLAAAVAFYGWPDAPVDDLAKTRTPIQAHFAKHDNWAKASLAEQLQAKVRGAGGHMDLYVYDAGHAFMREGDPAKYHAESARVAWDRAVDFLRKHLG
jgi:carboxymethylenebutenolidase